jgi:hypothetical protein
MTEKPRLNPKPLAENARDVREEFELACIREFSHSGLHLGVGVSREERRERIRAAILRENKAHRRWRNSDFTYTNMYAQAYRQSLGDNDIREADSAAESRLWRSALYNFTDDEGAFEGDDGISA